MVHRFTSGQPTKSARTMPPDREIRASGWALGGFLLIILAGNVAVRTPWAGYHGLMLGGAGLLVFLFAPRHGVPKAWWKLALGFVLAGMLPFLPANWFGQPAWRAGLDDLGVATGAMVVIQPRQAAEILALFAFTLFTGLWLAGHRPTPSQRGILALAFTLGVATYAILARTMEPLPAPERHSGDPVYGFFPNRNHTATLLAMGFVCGIGGILHSLRHRNRAAAVVGLFASAICLHALTAWSISRSGLILTACGTLTWLAIARPKSFGKWERFACVLLLAGTTLWVTTADSTSARRLRATFSEMATAFDLRAPSASADENGAVAIRNLDFRIPVVADTLDLVRDFPVTGIGAGQFYDVFPQYRHLTISRNNADGFHPDSDWLWMLCEAGPLATVALLALVLLAFGEALRGLRSGDDRVLRGACLAAAGLVPLHGWVDVPGHRIALAWSAAILFCLSLAPGKPPCHRIAKWPSRCLGIVMIAAAVVMVRAQWWGGRQPHFVAAERAVDEALALYEEDRRLIEAASLRGEPHQPAPEDDLLERAIQTLNAARKTAPLDRESPHILALLALQYDDRIDEAEHQFKVVRALDPSCVITPLDQAAALAQANPASVKSLWAEALRRAQIVDTVEPGTVWGRGYTLGRIEHQVRLRNDLAPYLEQIK